MKLIFDKVGEQDFDSVSGLIMDMYEQHLKRYYTEKGDEKFRKRASSKELKKRAEANSFLYLIKEGEELVGVLEFDNKVLVQFFIVDEFRGRGYGRMTINWLKKFYKENKLADRIEVMASPNAYLAFEKMGFEPISDEKADSIFVSKKMSISI